MIATIHGVIFFILFVMIMMCWCCLLLEPLKSMLEKMLEPWIYIYWTNMIDVVCSFSLFILLAYLGEEFYVLSFRCIIPEFHMLIYVYISSFSVMNFLFICIYIDLMLWWIFSLLALIWSNFSLDHSGLVWIDVVL